MLPGAAGPFAVLLCSFLWSSLATVRGRRKCCYTALADRLINLSASPGLEHAYYVLSSVVGLHFARS